MHRRCPGVFSRNERTESKRPHPLGPANVLAKRYESMRKVILSGKEPASILVLQEKIFHNLDDQRKKGFIEFNLMDSGFVVRDDAAAEKLYYRIFDAGVARKRDEKEAG